MNDHEWLNTNLESFERDGVTFLGKILSDQETQKILDPVTASRIFDSDLFLSESEFDENPIFKGVNPSQGRNFLNNIIPQLASIDNNAKLRSLLSRLLGTSYQILDRKLVCGIPERALPVWLKTRLAGKAVNNLGSYVKPQYRDITYFYGIDYHQDLIDWPGREPNFVTLYIYLDDVGLDEAPLTMLLGSHCLGATEFPHDLKLSDCENRVWMYRSPFGEQQCIEKQFTAAAGSAAAWHPCTLHGTTPATSRKARISLRYLISTSHEHNHVCTINKMNETLSGYTSQKKTRRDQNALGEILQKGNKLIESYEHK